MYSAAGFLWQSIKKYRWYYLVMILAPICGSFYKPLVFYAMKLMVDTITTPHGFALSQLTEPILIYLASDVLLTAVWRCSDIACWKAEPYVKRGILLHSLSTILSFRYKFFLNTSSGALTSKIKGLLEGYTNIWAQLYYGLLFWILASLIACFSIFFVNLYLGIIVLSYAAVFISINLAFAKKINKLSQQENEAKHVAIGEISDAISNIQSIKYFTSRKYEHQRLNDNILNNYIPKEQKSLIFFFKINLFNDLTSIFVFVLMLFMMIKLKSTNQITTGDFVFVFGIVFQFQENLWHLMQEYNMVAKQTGDLKSSLTLYSASDSEYKDGDITLQHKQSPKIEFKNILFNHDNNKRIFSDLNLTIHPGEKVGIVGYTGAGKSTLVNLILKTFIPQSGQILINDIDIADINNDQLRGMISLIPQDVNLFHRNLLENIRYGNLSATDEEVILASKKAYVDEFVSQLPEKYFTLVGDRGVKLSGGQRQRIAIARAILKNAPILILDEATSSLDSITEQYIQKSISELISGKTVIAIAHRLSTLKDMDRLIVLDSGKIIEAGNHDELLAKKDGLYAKIWHTQYTTYAE